MQYSLMTRKKRIRSDFIGRQLVRFKMGMSYFTLALVAINAAMNFKQNYDYQIEIIMLILIPLLIFGTLFIGYILDKTNINSQEARKSNELAHRFLLTSDFKSQAFQLMQTKILLKGMQEMKEGKSIDFTRMEDEYREYIQKWQSPQPSSNLPEEEPSQSSEMQIEKERQ